MINLIPDDERKNLTKEILIDLEGDILVRLGLILITHVQSKAWRDI